MSIVTISQKLERVEISSFEIDSPLILNYFASVPAKERDEKLLDAIHIGVLALMEDRLSAFFAKTTNELGVELESLKRIFELKREIFFKSSLKGIVAEEEIAEFLTGFFENQKLLDKATITGNLAGHLPRNKTGDIVCFIDGDENKKVVIECKLDKSVKLGDIASKDVFTRKSDTAWSQLIEAQANREGIVSIIVFDTSVIDNTILNTVQNVRFIPSIGFISIIDTQKGDYNNLAIAYMLARDIVVNAHPVDLDKDLLAIIVNRIIKGIDEALQIKDLVKANVDICKKILGQLEKSVLLMQFNREYLAKFLMDGQLTKSDLLEFYSGDEVRGKYRDLEKEIQTIDKEIQI